MSQALKIQPHALERRRHQRVKVVLFGRFMLENRQEYPCQTIDASPGGLAIYAPVRGRVGERVVIYLEHLGRVEGALVRVFDNGFAVAIQATKRKQDKLANQLTWLANRSELGLPEDRRHVRMLPRQSAVIVKLSDGRELGARIVDISLSGAALSCSDKLPIGTMAMVGENEARVVRHIEGGMAVEFLRPLTDEAFDETVEI
jgi:hypothetical protein